MLVMTMILLPVYPLSAQVTIGGLDDPKAGIILDLNSTTKGGLLLPNISISDLSIIPANTLVGIYQDEDKNFDLAGTIVYNTNASIGIGIYVWDGENWGRITADGSIIITGLSGNSDLFPADGSKENTYTVSDPSSKTNGTFSFTWISGERYIEQFSVLNAGISGGSEFSVIFYANEQASSRYAVLLVTSSDGKSATFVFTQEGDTAGCGVTAISDIKTDNNTSQLCVGGAVYLYLDNPQTSGVYIWTLNGEEIGQGDRYAATKPGVYTVYADKIGCTSARSIQVQMSNTQAPPPVRLIANSNNGVACGQGGTTELTVSTPASGTVYWYKNGVKQDNSNYNGQTKIQADKGIWQAVVVDGNCSSVFSDAAEVTEDLSTPLSPPVMKINGETDQSKWGFCQGGSAYLEVENYNSNYTYTWYADNTIIGTGNGIFYSVPLQGSILIRLRVTGAGCARETNVAQTIGATQAPPIPRIVGDDALCGGVATLTAETQVASPVFTWYKNGVVIPGETRNILTVTQPGKYRVAVMDIASSCVSLPSAVREIIWSNFVELKWEVNPQNAYYGETKDYRVSATSSPVSYKWTITQGMTDISDRIVTGQGTERIGITFPDSGGDVNVGVSGTNDCGGALNNAAMAVNTVQLSTVCPTPKIVDPSGPKTINVLEGETVSLSVKAANLKSPSYEWYTGTTKVSDTNPYSFTAGSADTKTFFCIVKNGCQGDPADTSQIFTVKISKNPESMATGSGKLAGRIYFDIGESNFDSSCGSQTARSKTRTDFKSMDVSDKTYTFTADGTGSNLRFVVNDPEGCLNASDPYTGAGEPNNFSNGSKYTLILNFKDLNTSTSPKIVGRTRAQAALVKIYAVFFTGANGTGSEVAVPLTIRIQDCMCCGAFIAPNVWKAFMCHNLGADESADPFVPSYATNGAYYQWGRKSMAKSAPNANGDDATFIAWVPSYQGGYFGNNTVSAGIEVKGKDDPCPAGFRVPNSLEWQGVFKYNTKTKVGVWASGKANWTGLMVGDGLMLPAAGDRDGRTNNSTGVLSYRGYYGEYWTASKQSGNNAYIMDIGNNKITYYLFTYGFSIRCIEE